MKAPAWTVADFSQGFMTTAQAGLEARNDVTAAIRNWYANRNPLLTRFPYVPVDRVDFQMFTHRYRPRSTTLGVAISANNTTAWTFGDATFLMNHDVLRIYDPATGNTEDIQINGDPTAATTANVIRGVSGTTPQTAYATATTTVRLLGNSRTGAEVSQTGLTSTGIARTQYCQTFQFPVQVGGSAQTTRAQVLPGGLETPFAMNMTMQLQNMCDDMETTMYSGAAQAPSDTGPVTAKMNGLQKIFTTNNTTSPTNAAAYAPTDFIRDTLQAARQGGGDPDVILVATNFLSGLAIWSMAVQRVPAGETMFGTPVNVILAPFLGDVALIEAPLLPDYTALCLTSAEIYIRAKRNPYFQQRGNRGDMLEGDWLAELAIEVANESHHSFVSGITAFSAN